MSRGSSKIEDVLKNAECFGKTKWELKMPCKMQDGDIFAEDAMRLPDGEIDFYHDGSHFCTVSHEEVEIALDGDGHILWISISEEGYARLRKAFSEVD